METIEELLEALRNPGEEGIPADLADRIHASYTAYQASADAKVEELTGIVQTRDAEIGALKSHNYDLIRATPAADADGDGEDEGDGDGDGGDFEDLFED